MSDSLQREVASQPPPLELRTRRPASSCVINYFELDPGNVGPSTHNHEFDQFYVVLEGELTVEVPLQKHLVGAGNLVVLPAGVPHSQFNGGSVNERHIALLAPPPDSGQPWDCGVDVCAHADKPRR